MPEKKEWVWGFLGPIPFLQQRFVPDVVIQQDRRGRVAAPPAGGAGNQPAAPATTAVPARSALVGRISDDEQALEQLEEARERERAADLLLRASRANIMADLKAEAVQAMENARTARILRWARQLPATPPIVDPEILEEIAPPEPEHVDRTPVRPQPQSQRHTLAINGVAVPQGRTRVNVPPNGYVTLNPAPGPQGYESGTQVMLIASPTPGSRVQWRGAGQQAPFRAIVTMDRDRQVQVTITPPAPRTVAQDQPTPGEAALDEQLQRAGR